MADSVMNSELPISGLYMDTSYYSHFPEGMKSTDGIPEELREVINEYWDRFPPVNPLIPHFFGVVFFFLWTISFTGNICVIYIFLKVKSLRTPSNVLIVNLALSDITMITTMAPPVVVNVFYQRYWAWGVLGCKIYGFIGAVAGTASIMNMIVIGYDRYNIIVKGFNGSKMTFLKAIIANVSVWVYCIATALPGLLDVWGGYATEGLFFTCGYDYFTMDWNHRSYILFVCVFNYFFPLAFIFYYYSSIVKAVWAHEHALREQAAKMNVKSLRSGAKSKESTEMKVAKVAVTNVTLWIVIWTPYAITNTISALGYRDVITPLVSQLPPFLAKLASVLNPVVYALSHPKYREALLKEIPCLGIGDDADDNDAETVKEIVKA